MITAQTAYILLVVGGFMAFMTVLASAHIYVILGERMKPAVPKGAPSVSAVEPIVAPPRVAEALVVGAEAGELASACCQSNANSSPLGAVKAGEAVA